SEIEQHPPVASEDAGAHLLDVALSKEVVEQGVDGDVKHVLPFIFLLADGCGQSAKFVLQRDINRIEADQEIGLAVEYPNEISPIIFKRSNELREFRQVEIRRAYIEADAHFRGIEP